MSLTASATRGAALTLGAQASRVVLQLVSVVVLARLLVPEDFGLVAMAAALLGVAEVVREMGLSASAVRAPELPVAERTNLFWASLGLGLVCALAVVASTPAIVALYDDDRLASVVPALAVVFCVSGANTMYRVQLGRDLRFGALAGADILAQLVGAATGIVLALLGAGFWALVAQQLVAAFVAFVVNVVNSRWWPGLPVRGVSIRAHLRFGLTVLGTQGLSYVSKNVDAVALGAASGATVLGWYNRAAQIVLVPLNQVNTPLTRVALPVLSRAHAQPARFVRAARRAQLVACYVTAPVLAVLAGLAAPLVEVLLGPGWSPVAPVLTLLAVGGCFRSVAQLSYWLFLASGNPGAQLRLDLWCQPLMVLVILAGVPRGASGVAAGVGVAWLGYWLAGVIAVGRTTGVPSGALLSRAALALGLVGVPTGLSAWGGASAVTSGGGSAWLALAAGAAAALVALGLVGGAVPAVRRDLIEVGGLLRLAVRRRARVAP